jgi:itaconate CoA-transferase
MTSATTSPAPRPRALDGITVVALEQAVAAPFATRQLADLGARVIKVERPGTGDFARHYDASVHGQASYFVWLNRGKESIELDLKDEADLAVLTALLARADVFVQNLAPGAAARLGLAAEKLRAGHPRLITCSISGYGDGGPYTQKKAYDLLVQCEAGLLSVTGSPDEPAKAGISVADIAAGMYAYSGILAALYERERTGTGSSLDVAMLEALGEWMSQPFYYSVYGGQPARRTGARHASISPYGPYPAADGGQVFLGLQNEREWAVLCTRVLGRPDLVTDPRFATNPDRVAHDGELTEIIAAALAGIPPGQLATRLDEAGIANARLRTPAEFAAHPQLRARDRWRDVATPGGPVRGLLPPVTVPGREAAMGAVPALGEHTAAIRDELGFGSAEASALTVREKRSLSRTDDGQPPARRERTAHGPGHHRAPILPHDDRRPAGAGRVRAPV